MHILIHEVSLAGAINQQIFKGGGISDKTAPVLPLRPVFTTDND